MTPDDAMKRVEEAITEYGKACQDFTRRLGPDDNLVVANGALLLAIREAVEAEREACAVIAGAFVAVRDGVDTRTIHTNAAASQIAAAIRARGR